MSSTEDKGHASPYEHVADGTGTVVVNTTPSAQVETVRESANKDQQENKKDER